ncbi:Bax inhibitor-1/YccA family protein [Snodgrassella sp. CFCC 13594]|uniref:Bax inhibitor-1/YccA family protein n=1 Tax=Snodgrassella sp. CFCC 13594 TaxID=1775559 RepID=UPI00082E856E|nr:Bax inhibitor-1/YccA family protein [Snodgrassella sp. CFCC 13594]
MQDFRSPTNTPASVPEARSGATFFNQVYFWMAAGLVLTGLMAWFTVNNSAVLAQVVQWYLPLVLVELAVVFALSGLINKFSGGMATAVFLLYSLLNGLTLSVIFMIYTQESIAAVFFIAAGMYAAAGVYGYVSKRDLTGFGQFLFMGLIGIVIAMVVNLFLKSPAVTWMVSVLGVFIFTGLTAYDHQKLRQMSLALAEQPQDDQAVRRLVVLGALTLYLDFINLFLMLLRLFGNRR